MVYRIFTTRRPGYALEADALLNEWQEFLHIGNIDSLQLVNRYDVEGISEAVLQQSLPTVFFEPQTDCLLDNLPQADFVFAVEPLPGQYDQRADSCAQCVQFASGQARPLVRTAKIFLLNGKLSDEDIAAIKKSVINPVECREATLDAFETLEMTTEIPEAVKTLEGFTALDEAGLAAFLDEYAFAMDLDDLTCCQAYFRSEKRDPTVTEMRMIDTYWSDHCRHTTFLTHLDEITIEDPRAQKTWELFLQNQQALGRRHKPITLMEVATHGMRWLKHTGQLQQLDESEEINACTVKTRIRMQETGGRGEREEEWLFLFKNETHNHPTEIEPFGGAATCIGGAIRDPLSGRGYVYQAMRVTGAADPTQAAGANGQESGGAVSLPGKLSQRKITTTAARGYSSYGNQIGVATGLVDELYHPGYVAKRMELGAVVGAVPSAQVRRETPQPGDKIILLGGRTGRDGCGGATGSSKSHTLDSLEQCGAEVQKGNAPEERKLQRLFRNPAASDMIKRCNDFGAGGVSVAIGELCDGLVINLDAVPKKYEGLDGTELAISESQERMAIVIAAENVGAFIAMAHDENLEATVVAEVQENPRLQMRWKGAVIVDLARAFLNSNGAVKHAQARISMNNEQLTINNGGTFAGRMRALAGSLAFCSRRGLAERFDSTVGAATVLMPFGGKYQQTPAQVMAAKFPILSGDTSKCSVMAYGFDPALTEKDPYKGAYCAVMESLAKLVAAGCPLDECYLSFQEYFGRTGADPARWGKPLQALLGALQAQLDFGFASIGGKDSMSGTFEDIDVPPTLVSFAVALCETNDILSNEFKRAGSRLAYLAPPQDENGLPVPEKALEIFRMVKEHKADILSAQAITSGGVAEAILKMSLGNKIGVALDAAFPLDYAFIAEPGAFLLEMKPGTDLGFPIGETIADSVFRAGEEEISLAELEALYEAKLEPIFPVQVKLADEARLSVCSPQPRSAAAPALKTAKPRVLIPAFPGTNCEYDTMRAFEKAGAQAEILVINNLSPADLADSIKRTEKALNNAQILFLPGGFSGGDEPDGSGKFITSFFRNPQLTEAIHALLDHRMGLVGGICNGFQALVKLGLATHGKIISMTPDAATLTLNTIGRHQSKLVRTRVASVLSPWLALCELGDIHTVPISHGEGRFMCPDALLKQLFQNGQIATQYVDMEGNPTMDVQYNPNGSLCAIEAITSPDGRVFGKMAHSERTGDGLYKNVPGLAENGMFRAAVQYYA